MRRAARPYRRLNGPGRLSLSSEGGQFVRIDIGEIFLCFQPADGVIEEVLCFPVVTQLVVGHGQEEQVEGCELAFSFGETAVQGRDRLGVLARAIRRYTQSIAKVRHFGSQCDGLPRPHDGSLWVAPGEGSGRVDPRAAVERFRVFGQQRASLLTIRPGLLMIAECLASDAAEVVQRVVVRILWNEGVKVGQRLVVPAEPDQCLARR